MSAVLLLAEGTGAVAVVAAPQLSRVVVAQTVDLHDVDTDRIPDEVEIAVCGTKTCATGLEDRDGDGIPDWVEVRSCGDRTCASPSKDRDGDGIPDFAERLVCGSDTCSNSTEDADGDGIGDWVEFVICGDRTCATGAEDYDGDGISDAAQLAACVKRIDSLALTGQSWFWGLLLVAAAGIGAGGLLLWRRRIGESGVSSGGEGQENFSLTGADK